jgi:EAL domain-containing protein (putative c-di-GMP-specific phosphodiesterase class I)
MSADLESHEIVRIIMLLAHNLGLRVVAEGIETQEQIAMLKELGCELAQGYFFSRPDPAGVIEELLENQRVAQPVTEVGASNE